ncbi:hypothetical protein P171DRAFT_482061 [Karstenula rhodostoma CBS 690.94]|uniref:Uncharacterized protein n=1 Tax=Karstenula rhodostoma CBS 690.94 TaxID=1392251 RepID=A0A9P4PRE0_9PLEO|nr:hypothetical protein P171DRAFT_482061 [Karstenula rhodostoma CBS 690.94]
MKRACTEEAQAPRQSSSDRSFFQGHYCTTIKKTLDPQQELAAKPKSPHPPKVISQSGNSKADLQSIGLTLTRTTKSCNESSLHLRQNPVDVDFFATMSMNAVPAVWLVALTLIFFVVFLGWINRLMDFGWTEAAAK